MWGTGRGLCLNPGSPRNKNIKYNNTLNITNTCVERDAKSSLYSGMRTYHPAQQTIKLPAVRRGVQFSLMIELKSITSENSPSTTRPRLTSWSLWIRRPTTTVAAPTSHLGAGNCGLPRNCTVVKSATQYQFLGHSTRLLINLKIISSSAQDY